ncbi:unannotated protein [freshwater metagenome]|uniref:Unannotated protein n=1 Tax=freshwater metagenome TaxID=449393 RepID=A0A6J6EFT7_9ZZZZ
MFQPANVKPVLVKEFAVRAVATPELMDCEEVEGDPDPSLALNVTRFSVNGDIVDQATLLPLFVTVFRPVRSTIRVDSFWALRSSLEFGCNSIGDSLTAKFAV